MRLSSGKFVLSVGILAFATNASAEEVVLTGNEAFTAMQKVICGTTEKGVTRYGMFEGRSFSRVPGEKDRHLFDVLGINIRQCNVVNDPERGKGFRSVSREIMVYMDPRTGEIVDKWENPWTGEMVDVMHVANDPVNMDSTSYELSDGKPLELKLRIYGNTAVSAFEVPLFYDNPLGGKYQKYVGGKYHAMEIFNNFYDTGKLTDPKVKEAGQNEVAWSRVAQWLPWMNMGDRSGLMIFNATGFSTLDKGEVPKKLMTVLEERYPSYLTPPPIDDERPNETSWTVFKNMVDSD